MSENHGPQTVIAFGPFEADLRTQELRKQGMRLRLPGQSFQVLKMLLERPGEPATREELHKALWPSEAFVDFEYGINAAVHRLREALEDSADSPHLIETLPRLGYRFIGTITTPPAATNAAVKENIGGGEQSGISWKVIIPAAIAVVALAAGSYFYFHRTPKLTEKDSVVLADFTNTTGDTVFDGTLRQGLSAQLEQSPFFNILSDDQIAATLRLMEKPPDTRLTHDMAREVCQRTNATVVIEGSIAALGNQYVMGLSTSNCRTGATLAEEQTTADGKEKVLAALGAATSVLRARLGESQASVDAYDVPLVQATTPSLDALQAYSRGALEYTMGRYSSAAPHFQRAVSLDQNFALAYGLLGSSHAFIGEGDSAVEEVTRAYALRDRVSEWEKMNISANYQFFGTGDLEQATQDFQMWTQTYPGDSRSWTGLAYVYRLLGRYDEALAAGRESIRLDPAAAGIYFTPIVAYIRLGRLDEAVATIHEAEARHLDFHSAYLLYWIDFLRNDETGMAEQAGHLGPSVESSRAAYTGRLARSQDLTQRAIALAMQAHANEGMAALEAESALTEALFGNLAEAKSAAMEASKSHANWHAQWTAGLALVLASEAAQAERLAADLNRRFPRGTFVQFQYLPEIRAARALHQGKPEEAVESLRAATAYELAETYNPMMPVYIRGEAYLSAHQGAPAAAEFQKILDHRTLVLDSPIGALAHLQIGRAYVMQGDTAKARAAYKDFLTLWKDADPDIPVLKQAKVEYAKLQ
jgi:DNA-binding winged helix-turn-helix (wHTH) protein/tetratricopeptide (TPR) repeat protein